MSPCVCSDSAACERLLRGKLRSPVFHFVYPLSFLPPSILFVCFLSCLSLSLLICSWEARSACQTTGCFSSLCGQTRSLRSHAWMHEVHNSWEEEIIYLPLRGGFLFLCFFSQLSLTSLFRSELLDVRMPSTGKIRWCLWAPLVLLALVSGVPSKAQDMGKCSPPPLLLSLVSGLHPTPTLSPGDSLSVSPDLYPSPLSSPLLTSFLCLRSFLFPHHLAVWCAGSLPSDYTIASPPFHSSPLPDHTHDRGV